MLSRQHEGKRTKTQTDRLEAQLQTEMKIRTDLENRNTSLDQEISKVIYFSRNSELSEKDLVFSSPEPLGSLVSL